MLNSERRYKVCCVTCGNKTKLYSDSMIGAFDRAYSEGYKQVTINDKETVWKCSKCIKLKTFVPQTSNRGVQVCLEPKTPCINNGNETRKMPADYPPDFTIPPDKFDRLTDSNSLPA